MFFHPVAESVPEQLNTAIWVNRSFCLHEHPPQLSISVLQKRLSFCFGEKKVKRRVTRLTSLKTVRPIFQKVASSWALSAIKIDPTKTEAVLVNWERASQWDMVASIIAHHQQPSPQNHLLFPGTPLHRNYSPFLSQSSPGLPQSSQSHPNARCGFSSQVPHINKAATLSSFSGAFTRHFATLGTLLQSGTASLGSVDFPGVQPPLGRMILNPSAQQKQVPAFPMQTHLAVKLPGLERRSPDLRRP